jgi:hypothetical protein
MAKFEFPKECDKDLMRCRTLSGWGLTSRNFKSRLYTQFHRKDQMPDFNEYPTLKLFWKAFTEYKDSEEAKRISDENQKNVKKNIIPHRIGSCGYAGKEEEFQEKEEKIIQEGAAPRISK